MSRLRKNFFINNTVWVAEKLLGKILVRIMDNSIVLKGKIVETEGYLGLQDPCCHSFNNRKTKRTEAMFLNGGHVYVYFTYGMYHCFNIVTGKPLQPEAVLIRAVEPLQNITTMQKNRLNFFKKTTLKKPSLTKLTKNNVANGPGKLCQAFDITKTFNKENLNNSHTLYIEDNNPIEACHIETSARVGLPPYQDASYLPLRFFIKNNPYISKVNL